MRYIFLLIIALLGFGGQTLAQDEVKKTFFKPVERKGKFTFFWGWNASNYSKSDIHFRGNGNDFVLKDVSASDRQSPFGWHYFNPAEISIPQYHYRLGYYFNDKYQISWGFNHMKYVMDALQKVQISGVINSPESGDYAGVYNDEEIELTKDFLQYEHTNGLNYLSFGLERTDAFWVSKNTQYRLNMVTGIGAGILYPKSDVILFLRQLDEWHVAGYGLSTNLALRFDFLNHFFVQGELVGGFIDMPDVLTPGGADAKASQNFFFFEQAIEFGGYFRLFPKK